jgi:glycerol-3-phosphate O-acyltransferase
VPTHVDRRGIHHTDFSDEIMASDKFTRTMAQLATTTERPLSDIERECKSDFDEIASTQRGWAVSTWDKLSRWLGRAYKLDVDDAQIDKIAELNKNSTLVFLPNHRSYLDPLILRSALEKHGFPPNHVLGGVNLSFFPMGSIARRNGTVFIRREFKDDVVYKACLKAYMGYLVAEEQNLEWYIEGGRTRTGKLRPPRMGIMSYLIDAFDVEEDKDVLIVPVFVGYDQQYEVGAISAEEQGASKAPESISWLIKFARAQTARRGRAHLRFGEPLSIAEALTETRESTDSDDARLAVPKISFEVMHRINQVTPIMPSALVTFGLLDNDDRAMTVDEGRRVIEPLLRYIKIRGLDLSEKINLEDYGGLYDTIRTLEREGVIRRYTGGVEDVYWIAENREHEAAFYRNTLIHHLINRAIVEVALIRVSQEKPDNVVDATWEEAVRLRDALKFEFFFPRTREYAEQIAAEVEIELPGWADATFNADDVIPTLERSRLYVAHRVIGPFLEAYGVLADRLALRAGSEEIDRDQMILECIGVAQARWYQKDLHSPESISRDLFSGALQLADNRGLLAPGTPDLKERRQAFAEEFRDAICRVDVIRNLADMKEEN